MKFLLIKDLVTQKPNLALGTLYSLFFYLLFMLTGETSYSSVTVVFSSVAVAWMVVLGSAMSDRGETQKFFMALPVSRGRMVDGKFVLLGIGALIGFLGSGLVYGALRLFGVPVPGPWFQPLDLLKILNGLLILSPIIPLYLRFGQAALRVGLVVLMAVFVVLQVVLLAASAFGIEGAASAVFGVLDRFKALPVTVRNLGLLAVGLVVAAASYAVSRLVVRRKDF